MPRERCGTGGAGKWRRQRPVVTRRASPACCGLSRPFAAESVGRFSPDTEPSSCAGPTHPRALAPTARRLGSVRDTVIRRLAHGPFGHRPTTLHIRQRRYRCVECGYAWRQDTTAAAPPRATTSRNGLAWALIGGRCAIDIRHECTGRGR